jgi:hypothetical protein
VTQVHLILGIALLTANAAAGAWGAAAWLRSSPSRGFWFVLRGAQALVVAQAAVGLGLVAMGRRAPDGLHMLYGIAPLVVSLVTEGMRVGAAQRELDEVEDVHGLEHDDQVALARRIVLRETGVMTVGALLIVTLALRALLTGS